MKATLIWTGKTTETYVKNGIREYESRIGHYHGFTIEECPHLKNADKLKPDQIKKKEAEQLLKKLNKDDHVILLDENGKQFTSVDFSRYLQKLMMQSVKRVVFVIGGAYGFDKSIYQRAAMKLSLSPMTFSHQLIRVIFLEQLYRANTIIRNEPYHNA